MGKLTKAGELAKALLDEYPTAGSLTLAKRLHKQYPEYYATVEHARGIIRTHRGAQGTAHRRKLVDLRNVKDIDKVLADKFALPEPAVMQRDPYFIPKINDKIIVFGDAHFPYQNNKGIYSALNYGAKKGANCFILNGDMVDLYQDSRFTKDNRKPNLEYEIEVFYEFLQNMREAFPDVLIIWKFGNHEERYDTYWKNNAPLHYSHATSLDEAVLTPQLNITVVKDKRRIVCADLNILHGHEYNGGSGQVNPARAIFLKARANCLVNHFHRSSKHQGNDINGKQIRTYSLGAMCATQDYSPYGDQDCSFGFLQVVDGVCWVQNREVV